LQLQVTPARAGRPAGAICLTLLRAANNFSRLRRAVN
jgi:hypothetical protein